MESHSNWLVNDTKAYENGVFVFQGREYAAGGSFIDLDNGILLGYPMLDQEGRVILCSWGGQSIMTLRHTGRSRGFHGIALDHWGGYFLNRYWHGKNVGIGMLLRMRSKKP